MRTSDRTHPWINFELDMGRLSTKTWLLLGQAQAKCEQLSGVPLLPRFTNELHLVYLAKGAHATTAIEGNSLTEEEVRRLLEAQLRLPPSREYLGQEVDNVVKACNLIGEEVRDNQDITVAEMQGYNAMVLEGLPPVEHIMPGKFRAHAVRVTGTGYEGAPAEDLGFLLQSLCKWLNTGFTPPDAKMGLVFDILKAIIAHVYIAWIHPFGDGNGRTARLLEFRFLLAAGVPTAAAHLLSNHYNRTRAAYYRELASSSRQDDGLYSFIEYSLQGFVDGLDEQIELIEVQHMIVHWEHHIHEVFRDLRSTPASSRRERLILDMARLDRPIPVSELRHITPQIAEAYADKTNKTVRRDINWLGDRDLIRATADGYIPNYRILKAFLARGRPGQSAD